MVVADLPFDDGVKEFAPLFQPLKDLARNWNIDIEKCLAGFVEWVRKVTEVKENSGGRFNFAEAARVVSGGAEVYGRKIDYVHQLARGCFEQLSEKAKKKHDKGCNDGEVDENAQMEVPDIPDDPCEFIDLGKLRAADRNLIRLKNVECKPAKLIPQIPMEMAPLTVEEKINLPLYDSIHPTVLIGMRDDFKVNTAFNHESGTLLLDLISEKIMDDFTTQEIVAEVTQTMRTLRNVEEAGADQIGSQNEGSWMWDNVGGDHCEINRETQGTHPTCQMEGRDSTKLVLDESMPVVDNSSAELFDNNELQLTYVEDGTHSNGEDDEEGVHSRPTDVEKFIDDEVEEVDIFSECKYRSIPHKVAKCYKLASSVIQRRKKKRISLGLSPEISFMDYFHNEVYRKGIKKSYLKYDFSSNDVPLLAVSEFTEKERKRRLALRNSLRKQETRMSQEEVIGDAIVSEEHEGLDNGDFNDSDSDFELNAVEANNADLVDNEENKFAEVMDKEDAGTSFGNVMYSDRDKDDSNIPAEEMSFSSRLRHYLNLYWAEGEAMESKLDERVQKWDETVSPLLEEECERRPFDIHQYGTELLQEFQDLGQQKPFFDLVREVPEYDVGRYFLSSLVLANTYNVEISYNPAEITESNKELTGLGNSYILKLVSLERHHEDVEDLQS